MFKSFVILLYKAPNKNLAQFFVCLDVISIFEETSKLMDFST